MGVLDMIRGRNDDRVIAESAFAQSDAEGKETGATSSRASDSDTLSLEARGEKEVQVHPDQVTDDAQLGVQKAEAAALVWSKTAVILTYAWIWVCFFMLAFQSSIQLNTIYNAYATFTAAPEVSTAGILANIIGGVLKLPIAKSLNIWGRAEGFVFWVAVYILGIVVLASCNGPNGYAAGYVFYWVGYDSIYLILQIFIADTSGLKNRAWAFGFASTPFIATAFVGPLAAQSFLDNAGWRWANGAFAIIMPVVFLPLAIVFKFYQKKAEKMGLFVRPASGRTFMQSTVHYIHQFDIMGCLLLMAAFILFLLPFSLETYGRAQYKSATFIAMVVIGFLLFFVFAAWEAFFARVQFIRWELFRQSTVLGACCLAAILYFSFYSWDLYYQPFVRVVYDLNTSEAGYMGQIYNIGSCFWSVVFGVYVRYTKHFKYACLFFGLPLMFLGAGLTIYFRGNDSSIGYVVMCQIFIAFAGGTLVIGEDMAVMACADRDGVPMMLSLLGLSASFGGAIGYAVSAAIYANTWVSAFISRAPADAAAQAFTISLGGYTTQQTYAVGTQTRDAIDFAYGQTQKYGGISATAVLVLAIPAIAIWKNYSVDKRQNKGVMI